ncbi:MAG: RNA-binding protein [Hyphomicrobiaceae bacterium]|nr:RNA-binding protein [Hyphomicrobiaceae bacterium]MCC0009753.1 RNA-binding protein [Hyphomicrobiaceae bacterium]
MANKSLFASYAGRLMPRAKARNRAGAPAYEMEARHKLAQLVMTGTLSPTYYANAEAQLSDVMKVAEQVSTKFLAKTAVYARKRGHMKDMPALLLAVLSRRDPEAFARVFPHVVDNGRMLRTFVQIMRSGATGRKSLGSRPKAEIQGWLNAASDRALMRAAVGRSPSLADIVKMVHPKPASPERRAFYAWLVGKPYDVAALPEPARSFEAFKRDRTNPLPDVPFEMLTALDLTAEHWAEIAGRAGWQMLRMNLNTFDRQCAFAIDGFTQMVAARLKDPTEIAKARVMPYQLMAAYHAAGQDVPHAVREALQDAMDISLSNVPAVTGNVVIAPDVSGSMTSPVTGRRMGATSTIRCVDVAALFAAAMLRQNPSAKVLPFERDVVNVDLNPRDTVMTNAKRLASIGGGATNCSAPLAALNKANAKVDLVVFISDNQSWVDARRADRTGLMTEWTKLKRKNRNAKLVAIDIQPYATTQAPERDDILNVGGFSDAAFEIVANFATGQLGHAHWVGEIEMIEA